MRRTPGLAPTRNRVQWTMTVPAAHDLARHLRALTELEPERDLGGCLTHAADDLDFMARAATAMGSANEAEGLLGDFAGETCGLVPS